MSIDLGNLGGLFEMIKNLMPQLQSILPRANINRSNQPSSGSIAKKWGTEAASLDQAARGDEMNFMASILPQLLGPAMMQDQYKQQKDYEKWQSGYYQQPGSVLTGGLNASPVRPGALGASGEGSNPFMNSPSFESFGQGWGGTPLSHQQEGAFDWGKRVKSWMGGGGRDENKWGDFLSRLTGMNWRR